MNKLIQEIFKNEIRIKYDVIKHEAIFKIQKQLNVK